MSSMRCPVTPWRGLASRLGTEPGDCCRTDISAGWRCWNLAGTGVGAALLEALVGEARRLGMPIPLNAQTHAQGFYAPFGFVPTGPQFEEAGLPHPGNGKNLTDD